ncbi:hybrid sensor histidine kinase/response regulator [Sphingomonas sp. MMS24-J45]|uniref:ATP-binding response regulator n=1 Tax=Sphingomonas sp. MMS24-J45 TaxID=3238806 RepID=UPI00384B22BD
MTKSDFEVEYSAQFEGLDEVPPDRILTEQVRVVYRLLGRSAWLTLALSMFVAAILRNHGQSVWWWLTAQGILKLSEQVEVNLFYDPVRVADNPHRMVQWLCFTQSLHAAGWASLIWITGEHATPAEFTFILMALGGVLSGGVTTYGAMPQVHAAYIATFIAVNVATFFHLRDLLPDNPYFYMTPVLCIFYCIGTYMNTRVSGADYHRYISLGFANAALARNLAAQVEKVESARREAEAANAAKSTFLASASHDLRQPIHAAGLFMALLADSRLKPPQREMLSNATSALNASSEMLDALLDFSRAEAGVIAAQSRVFAIDDLLNEVESELGLQADEKRLSFRLHESGALVASDPALVRLILLNLVSNALRYTESGGILLGTRRRGARLVVEVWDTGIGIESEQHQLIFEDFRQIGNPERDRRKGLGLGLAIVRRLARIIESEVTLASRPGRGSVFRFDLPLIEQTPADMPLPTNGNGTAIAPYPKPPAGDIGTAAHILLLDDDPAILQGLGALLRQAGYSVSAVDTIEAALESAETDRPDLFICDFRLRHGRHGLEAAIALDQLYARTVPVLLITGDTHPDRIAQAAGNKIPVLFKPVEPRRILDTVAQLTG